MTKHNDRKQCRTDDPKHCVYAIGLTIADAVPETIISCVVCGFDSAIDSTQEFEPVPDRAIDLSTWED